MLFEEDNIRDQAAQLEVKLVSLITLAARRGFIFLLLRSSFPVVN